MTEMSPAEHVFFAALAIPLPAERAAYLDRACDGDAALRDLHRSLDGRAVAIDLAADLPLVRADPRLLHHILINLIDNGARHGGGAIRIAGRRVEGGVALSVEDEGPGLGRAPEALFGTFERIAGSDRKGGAGLGLAIVKGFAEAMGLSVAARNRKGGKGAVVTLSFPAAAVVAATAGHDAETA